MRQLPDPKTVVDSVADGALEVVEAPVRAAENVAAVATVFASEAKSNLDSIKGSLPDNPDVLPDVAVKAVGQTVNAGIGLIEGFGKAIMDTLEGVRNQIRRVTG